MVGQLVTAIGYVPEETKNQATLTSPDGKYKTVVNVGSIEASQLLVNGWTVGVELLVINLMKPQ